MSLSNKYDSVYGVPVVGCSSTRLTFEDTALISVYFKSFIYRRMYSESVDLMFVNLMPEIRSSQPVLYSLQL